MNLPSIRWVASRPSIVAITLTVLCAAMAISAQAQSSSEYEAITQADPTIPKDELAIILKPLTKNELLIEADAWLLLVKNKVRQISAAELAIKHENQQIESAKNAAEAVEEAQEAAAEVEKAKQKVTDPDRSQEEIAKAAEKAAQAEAEAKAATEEAEKVRERTEQSAEAKAAAEEAERAVEEEEDALAVEDVRETPEAAVDDQVVGEVSQELLAQAEAAKADAEGGAKVKSQLLDNVNRLRDERTGLIDRAKIVLTELETKGGETEEQRLYIAAVSGVAVDVSDWEAFGATVRGWVTSDEGGLRWARNVIKFTLTLVVFWVLSFFVGRIAARALRTRYTRKLSQLMRDFLETMARRIVLAIGFIVALAALEVNIGPLLAVIGAAGFVVAFALQDSLSNFANGIMILVYRPFDVGDVVEVAGVSGTVTALNLVSVTIKTFDNKTILVPNNKVWNDSIVNATNTAQRRVDMVFGIGYSDDIDKAQAVLEKIVKDHPLTLADPAPVVKVHELADSSVNFICRPWVKTADYWNVYWDITRSVKLEFDREGITIPFPQTDIHLHNVDAAQHDSMTV